MPHTDRSFVYLIDDACVECISLYHNDILFDHMKKFGHLIEAVFCHSFMRLMGVLMWRAAEENLSQHGWPEDSTGISRWWHGPRTPNTGNVALPWRIMSHWWTTTLQLWDCILQCPHFVNVSTRKNYKIGHCFSRQFCISAWFVPHFPLAISYPLLFLCFPVDCDRSADWTEDPDSDRPGTDLPRKAAVHSGQCRLLLRWKGDTGQTGVPVWKSHPCFPRWLRGQSAAVHLTWPGRTTDTGNN